MDFEKDDVTSVGQVTGQTALLVEDADSFETTLPRLTIDPSDPAMRLYSIADEIQDQYDTVRISSVYAIEALEKIAQMQYSTGEPSYEAQIAMQALNRIYSCTSSVGIARQSG